MSESRKQFEEWALQTEHAFRNKNGLWFYPSHSERDMFTGWSARDSEVERLRTDAERYRWLRQAMATPDLEEQDRAIDALNAACRNPVTPSEFDAAIDAARAALSRQVKESK